MQIIFSKPRLYGLSQGERISYVRQLRMMTQYEVSDKLGITGECKRRTMTRYERDQRKPSNKRLNELSKILQVNINSIKQYNFKNIIDLIYLFSWLEELYPNFGFKMDLPNNNKFNNALLEWNNMRIMKNNKSITYEQYLDWKLSYETDGCR